MVTKLVRVTSIFFLITILFFPNIAYANSSWHWVTYSPEKILPIAIILTLIIESFGLFIFGGVKNSFGKVLVIVTFANLMSFVFPYIERANRFLPVAGDMHYAWIKAFNSGPYYIVLSGYLLITLLIEIPLVYYFLKPYAGGKKLIISIITANILTTVAVGVVERLLCSGQW